MSLILRMPLSASRATRDLNSELRCLHFRSYVLLRWFLRPSQNSSKIQYFAGSVLWGFFTLKKIVQAIKSGISEPGMLVVFRLAMGADSFKLLGMKLFQMAVLLAACSPVLQAAADDDFPIVPEDVEVALFARDPLVRNPCAITFDTQGRLCVGMGPQYRKPKPETPGDSVWILVDEDGDGTADSRKEFAKGFNSIQGLAWNGGDLWVGNAPDLTLVRDLDGDDEADEYIRIYTDLGNLEHGVHGLNFAPDGMLYFSKGNSKGLTQLPDRLAPQPFRELWGVVTPPGTPDFPPPVKFTKDSYQRNYHDPSDDWGLSGGVLRCEADGSGLEIVARGFRNPWDICFDDGFNWLGTDNDQTVGDKIFAPFYGANFGWGHPWSFDWMGDDHLPSAPSSGPPFEGSGTGVAYAGLENYPDAYRGVFLINDWLRREVYVYRPRWEGAWMKSADEKFKVLAHAGGGRSMGSSDGRSFDPVDIEIGPDGAIYISSWGRQYGLEEKDGVQVNEGRIYRIWPKAATPQNRTAVRDPWQDLGSHVPAWRTAAQNTIVQQGATALPRLKSMIGDNAADSQQQLQTWALWTLARIAPQDSLIDELLVSSSQNLRIQALRIAGQDRQPLPDAVRDGLGSSDARVRHAAVLAMHEAGERRWNNEMLELAHKESDRIVFYSLWTAMRDLMTMAERKALLGDARVGVRRAALLSLLEDDLLTDEEIEAATSDADAVVASLATKRLGGKAAGVLKGPSLVAKGEATLLTPPDSPTTTEAALAAMPEADAERGRTLFLSSAGANCTICHQMEGIGNVHAPGLADIGSRADAKAIISSILEPSDSITEGFAMQVVRTKSGQAYAGILIEETGRALKLALVNGDTVSVPAQDIAERTSTDISAMPATFPALLTPQQVADITAYLLQGVTARRSKGFHIEQKEGALVIALDGQDIVTYFSKHEQTRRPFFAHVKTPGGIQVSRNFPPISGVDPTDHGFMHPGISLGFAVLDGENFWHNDRGIVTHEKFLTAPESDEDSAMFTVLNNYQRQDGTSVCRETASYRFSQNADGYLITTEHVFTSPDPFYFGVKEEMGLAIRVASPIRVKGGNGGILNSNKGINEDGTWGKAADWWDYSGTIDGRHVGMQVMSGKGNPPVWSHSRDYGLLVANPFPVDKKANREKRLVVQPGTAFTLRFGVQVHESDAAESYDPRAAFERHSVE